jgi:hypothetical protein
MMKLIIQILDLLFKILGMPYYIVIKLKDLIIKAVNTIWANLKSLSLRLWNIILKIINAIKLFIIFIPRGCWNIIKYVCKWFLEALKESIAQIFTLLGFFIAWLTLTGSAKDIVGIAILISISLWLLTMGLRKD